MPSAPLALNCAKIKAVCAVFRLRNQHIINSKMFRPTGILCLKVYSFFQTWDKHHALSLLYMRRYYKYLVLENERFTKSEISNVFLKIQEKKLKPDHI